MPYTKLEAGAKKGFTIPMHVHLGAGDFAIIILYFVVVLSVGLPSKAK
jgi:hypothetical protein